MPLKEVKIPKYNWGADNDSNFVVPVGNGGKYVGDIDLEEAAHTYQQHLKELEQELLEKHNEGAKKMPKVEKFVSFNNKGEVFYQSYQPFITDSCAKEDSNIFNKKDLVMKPVLYHDMDRTIPALEIRKVNHNCYIIIHNEEGGLVGKVVSDKSITYKESSLLYFCKALIKSTVKSGELGYKTAKNKLEGKEMRIEELVKGYKRKNGDVIDCITVNSNGRNLKFLLDDIEIVYPDVKGICFPKDREIRKGTMVKCMNNKHTKFSRGEVMEVVAIDRANKLITVNSNGKRYLSSIKRFKAV